MAELIRLHLLCFTAAETSQQHQQHCTTHTQQNTDSDDANMATNTQKLSISTTLPGQRYNTVPQSLTLCTYKGCMIVDKIFQSNIFLLPTSSVNAGLLLAEPINTSH